MIFGNSVYGRDSNEITAEQVEHMLESMVLTESKNYQDNFYVKAFALDQRRKKIVSKGIADIVNCLKGTKSNDRKQQSIGQIITGIYTDLGELFYVFKPSDKMFLGMPQEQVQKAIVLMSWLLLAVFIEQTVCAILFPKIYEILVGVIAAPILEESAKQIALRGGFQKEFLVIFNTLEFTEYVIIYAPIVGLIKIFAARLMAVGLHITTTIVQWISMNKEFQKKVMRDPNDPKEKAELEGMGLATGMMIHALWNLVATIS